MSYDSGAARATAPEITQLESDALTVAAQFILLSFIASFRPNDTQMLIQRKLMAREILKGKYYGLVDGWNVAE